MPDRPNPLENQQCERFVRRLANTKRMFIVSGEDGLARVPSQKQAGRETVFAWTTRAEAERWADCICDNPRVKELYIGEILADFLPALSEHRRLIATDWTTDNVEGECEPQVLRDLIQLETVDAFMQRVATSGNVYILENTMGPALLVSATRHDQMVLPCWSQREVAESRLEGPWANHTVMRIPLANFVKITLPWLQGQDHKVAPDHVPGSQAIELEAGSIAGRIEAKKPNAVAQKQKTVAA
ncbi:MAG: DUF2750 domain-containing protein [Pseudomonadota bacterium]